MALMTEAIEAYTGLSPTAFFTILALMFGVYKLVCGLFVDPLDLHPADDSSKNLLKTAVSSLTTDSVNTVLHKQSMGVGAASDSGPAEDLGEVSEEQLKAYDGSDPTKPLLMAIKGQIYDVSPSRMFYGPGGPYALFAGRDASRALALMSFDPNDLTGNLEGLEVSELQVLQDWEYKFQEKYKKVGRILGTPITRTTKADDDAAADEHHIQEAEEAARDKQQQVRK